MDMLQRMNGALNYIEENLADEIDFKEVARRAYCSEYHFKRMFSFLAGITLSEYIRRRRLTLAALDLIDRDVKVIDVALKYGYSSPDAFTRAFQGLHGITPARSRSSNHSLKAFPRMTFQLTIKGGIEMQYRIEEKDRFQVVGLKHRIKLVHEGNNPDIENILAGIRDETYAALEELSNVKPFGVLHVTANYTENETEANQLDYYVAAASTKACPDGLEQFNIPAFTWAVFEVEGDWAAVQDAWGRIYTEWFPSSGYEHAGGPEILASTENKSEIWVPVSRH